MSSNIDITINDFEHICRTCLCREDLQPLYENCNRSTYVVDMLMSCTFVKFTEDDGLPMKICTNCILEIDHAISFAKRCETTDTILRNCVEKFETELANNSSEFQIFDSTIKAEKEIILPNMHRTGAEVCLENVKQEEIVKIEIKPEIILPNIHHEFMEEIKQEQELIIENKCEENDDYSADEYYEEDQDETYTEKSDNPGSKPRYTNFKVEEGSSKEGNAQHSESNDQMYQCQTSDTSFKRLDLLKAHQRKEEKASNEMLSNDFQCTICDRTFTGKKCLQRHALIHKKKKFLCSVCKRSYVSKDLLNSHSKVHTAQPYPCHVCGKACSNSSDLKKHELIHTGEKPHVCSICGKAFLLSHNLKFHMRTHTGEKPYSCEVCGKSFLSKVELTRHNRTHTGEKPYVCSVCSKAFAHQSTFNDHMKIHTGEKPYSCEVCGKSFSKNIRLTLHKQIHTGEKLHVCSVCNKAYARRHDLKHHIVRIHMGEKPYICTVCNKAFPVNQNLKCHMRIHTMEEPYSCGICVKGFSTKNILASHKRKFHNEANEITPNKI